MLASITIKKKIVGVISWAFNSYFDLYTGGKNRPVFFDIERSYPRLNILKNHYDTILNEFLKLRDKGDLTQFESIDQYQYDISAVKQPNKKWKVFIIHSAGQESSEAREICPETCALLDKIPDLFLAFFSVLEPGKSIPAHKGPYRGYIRYHLTLQAPEINPPSIRVKDQVHIWENKNTVLFDDSWEHEVYNKSDEERAVFIVDILRPMGKLPDKINRWVVKKIIGPYYGKKVIRNQRDILNPKEV